MLFKGRNYISPPPFLIAPGRRWCQSNDTRRPAFQPLGISDLALFLTTLLLSWGFSCPLPTAAATNAIATTTKGNKKRLSSPSLHIKSHQKEKKEADRRILSASGLSIWSKSKGYGRVPFVKETCFFLIEPFSAHRCLLLCSRACPLITPMLFFIPPSLCRVRQAL